MYNAHVPPMTATYSMYSTSGVIMQPQGPPQGGIYATMSSAMPYQTFPQGTPFIITTQSVMFRDMPVQCTCPNCHHVIVTRIQKTSGLLPWLICCVVFLFVGALGCCLIPFCIDGLKVSVHLFNNDRTNTLLDLQDTEHYCPQCATLLGSHRRLWFNLVRWKQQSYFIELCIFSLHTFRWNSIKNCNRRLNCRKKGLAAGDARSTAVSSCPSTHPPAVERERDLCLGHALVLRDDRRWEATWSEESHLHWPNENVVAFCRSSSRSATNCECTADHRRSRNEKDSSPVDERNPLGSIRADWREKSE